MRHLFKKKKTLKITLPEDQWEISMIKDLGGYTSKCVYVCRDKWKKNPDISNCMARFLISHPYN